MSALTTRFGGWFKRMRPEGPIQVEVRGAGRPASPGEVGDAARPPHQRPGERNGNGSGTTRNGLLSRLPGTRRDAAIDELRHGYGEVLGLMRAMRDHMDRQGEFNQHMLGLLSQLPEALKSLPETNRNQSHMLEAMQTHFEQQGRHAQRLNEAIASLATAGEHQAQVLGLVREQIEAGRDSEQMRYDTLAAMNESLHRVSASSEAGAVALRQACDARGQSDRRMEDLMHSHSRYMKNITTLLIAGGVLTALAFGAAAYAVMLIAGAA